MYRKLTAILVTAGLVLAAWPARAAFENLMVSPRARAMGDASVAVSDAPFAAILNPAGLAGLEAKGAAGASYVQPYGLDFHRLYYLGAAVRVPGAGGLGVGFRQYGVEYQDVDLTSESTFIVAYGLTLYEDIHSRIDVGVGASMYRLEYGETVGEIDPGDDLAAGLDVGLTATLHERTRAGVLVHNVNSPRIGIDEEELPRRLQAGISYEPYAGVVTIFELENTQDEPVQWRGGMEMEIVQDFHLRAGIMTEPNKLTGGFGYRFGDAAIDYGFSTGGGVLDSSHQFGVTWTWGGE